MTTETWIRFCRANGIPSMALHEVGADEASTINGGGDPVYIRPDAHCHMGERVSPPLEDMSHLNPRSSVKMHNLTRDWWNNMTKAERQQETRKRKANAQKPKKLRDEKIS